MTYIVFPKDEYERGPLADTTNQQDDPLLEEESGIKVVYERIEKTVAAQLLEVKNEPVIFDEKIEKTIAEQRSEVKAETLTFVFAFSI